MVLEAIMIWLVGLSVVHTNRSSCYVHVSAVFVCCLYDSADNSEPMRNGDYSPTRLEAQVPFLDAEPNVW
jgi:hypothetical protein